MAYAHKSSAPVAPPKKEYPQSPPKETYRTGDGDTPAPVRVGSCHKHLKSFGHLT